MNGDESQGGDGMISGALVERNVIYGNGVGGGSGINMDGVTDSVVDFAARITKPITTLTRASQPPLRGRRFR